MCYMQDDCTFKSKSVDGVGDHVKKEHLNLKEGLGCVFEGCNFRGTAMPEMKSHILTLINIVVMNYFECKNSSFFRF